MLTSRIFGIALAATIPALTAAGAHAQAPGYNKIQFQYQATQDGQTFDLPAAPDVAAPQPKAEGQDFQNWQKNLGAPAASPGQRRGLKLRAPGTTASGTLITGRVERIRH